MNRLLADNATYFQNEKFKTTLSQQNIEEVTKFLRLLTHEHHEDWVRHVQSVEDFINHTPHTVTEECPAYLMNRRMPPTPWDPFPEEADDYDTRVQRVREKLMNRRMPPTPWDQKKPMIMIPESNESVKS
ncbi:hypothetical protein QE152_g37311 [Popillia japonica]|uniref:Uncharacterized protein n=1 Tax=Popillia japonica TaxID=7064 RepID=A0AAW1IAV5_POPJA